LRALKQLSGVLIAVCDVEEVVMELLVMERDVTDVEEATGPHSCTKHL